MPEKCYVLKDYRKYRYNPLELIFTRVSALWQWELLAGYFTKTIILL